MTPARLDILLYAHDGRGLGHASRSVAIGMALRRLYPALRVLLVTGCRQSQEMIGRAPLDWLKLPSYETEVSNGRSRGIDGLSNFSDGELGDIRQEQIFRAVESLRPRLLLADHTPQGKHKELLTALSSTTAGETMTCVLGMRGVIGTVAQAESPVARETYSRYYSTLLWYGDSHVLGSAHKDVLSSRFGDDVRECGYVSRLKESRHYLSLGASVEKDFGCTVSVPWSSAPTERFLELLTDTILSIGDGFGPFRLFFGAGLPVHVRRRLDASGFCSVEPFSSDYLSALCRSRAAVVFGGYNSLVDVLAAEVPSLVVLRSMQDQEQEEHVASLAAAAPHLIPLHEQDCNSTALRDALMGAMRRSSGPPVCQVNLDGAERAARTLASLL